jgi:hypothetical protein
MKTGEVCARAGTYVAKCAKGHVQTADMPDGMIFLPCGERVDGKPCGLPLDWELRPLRTH